MEAPNYPAFMERLAKASGPTFQRWESFFTNQATHLPQILAHIQPDLLEQIQDEQVIRLIWRQAKSCLTYSDRRQLMSACQERLKALASQVSQRGAFWFKATRFFSFLFRMAQLLHLVILIATLLFLLNPLDYAFEGQPFLVFHLVFWLAFIAIKVFSRLSWRLKTDRQPFYFKTKKTLLLVLSGIVAALLSLVIIVILIIALNHSHIFSLDISFLFLFVYLITTPLIVPLWGYVSQKELKPHWAAAQFLAFVCGFVIQMMAIFLTLLHPDYRVSLLYLIPYLILLGLRTRWRYQETTTCRYRPAINRYSYHTTRLLKRLGFALCFSFLLLVSHSLYASQQMEMTVLTSLAVIYFFFVAMVPMVNKFILKDDLLYIELGQEISWSNDLIYLTYRGLYGYKKPASPQVSSWLESYRFWHCVEHHGLGRALQHDFFIEHVDMIHQQLERWECTYATAFFTDLITHLELEKLPKSERKISTLKAGAEQFMSQGGLLVQEQEDRLLQQIPLIKWHLHQDYRKLAADFKFAEAME